MKKIALVLFSAALFAQSPDISGERIRPHVKFLSSDLLEGRGVGERGGDIATEYIASQLALAGAKPAGDNGTYFQRVPMVGVTVSPESRVTATSGTKSLDLRWSDDFVATTHRQQPQEHLQADLIFIGHGIDAPDYHWNDYKNVDVRGKVVVLFTNEPQPDNPEVFKGKALTYYGRWIYKFEEATRKGALGAIIVHTAPTAGYGWQVIRNSSNKESPEIRHEGDRHALAFAGWVTEDAGDRLFALSGHSVRELMQAADSRDFRPIPLNTRISVDLRAKIRPIETRNVIGVIPGSDPVRSGEYVVFSAHWDHLGIAMPVKGDAIYNGAVDNGTGCGILLEIARAWGALKNRPRRSALFISFAAEEAGLRGSEFYAGHPLVPLTKTAVDINYDALMPFGRMNDLIVDRADDTTLGALVTESAAHNGMTISPNPRPEQGGYYRSDQLMLARAGVPGFRIQTGTQIAGKSASASGELFTEFNTLHYHQPSDQYHDDWDFSGLEQAARFGMDLGLAVANMDAMPEWRANNGEFPVKRHAALGD